MSFTHASVDDPTQPCLAVGLNHGAILLWSNKDILNGSMRFTQIEGQKSTACSLCFLPDSNSIAAGYRDGRVCIWDTRTMECLATPQGSFSPIPCIPSMAFSLHGHLLAVARKCGTVWLWNLTAGMDTVLMRTMPFNDNWLHGMSFSSDGLQLALGGADCNIINVLSIPGGTKELELQQGHSVSSLKFSPVDRSNLLAVGDCGAIVKVWDTKKKGNSLVYTLRGHTDWVWCVDFSHDGSLLCSGSYDKTVRLWNIITGQPTLVLRGHKYPVYEVAFHPNGKQLASCSLDKTVRVWTVCNWSDRTNLLFFRDIRRVVFTLMCVRYTLETRCNNKHSVSRLPIEIWIHILFIFTRSFVN
jgi:WD40 repeat protein